MGIGNGQKKLHARENHQQVERSGDSPQSGLNDRLSCQEDRGNRADLLPLAKRIWGNEN
tara:strand:- start:647 stop:823 length:177 start_codon:yes stop_codon:yes gene_type:complete